MNTDKFWALTEAEPTSGCLLWTGNRNSANYGRFYVDGKYELAHRVAWRMKHGPIPPGVNVLHRCDVPPCVQDAHLFLGTQQENIADCIRKGRNATGDKVRHAGPDHPRAHFTWRTVRAIRAAYLRGESTAALTAKYAVARGTMESLLFGRNWPDPNWTTALAQFRQTRRHARPFWKLTWEQVRQIRERYQHGASKKALGRAFGVSDVMIAKITNGDSWKEAMA